MRSAGELVVAKQALWTPPPSEIWIPPRDVLRGIRDEKRKRLERDYRFVYDQLTGRRPRGDWLDRLEQEIARWAAPAFVNKGAKASAASQTSITVNYSGATAGNFLSCCICSDRFSTTAAAYTTTALTSAGWTIDKNPVSVGSASGYSENVILASKANIAAGAHSAQITGLPALTYSEGIISEYSGILTSSPTDQTANNASGTAGTSGNTGTTGTTAQASELAIGICHASDGTGSTASFTQSPTGYTNLTGTTSNSATIAWSCFYRILSATGTQVANVTWSANSIWAGAISTYKDAAGGGGGGSTLAAFYYRMLAGLC